MNFALEPIFMMRSETNIEAARASAQDETVARLRGVELIARKLRSLPNAPGVYRMIGENDEALYVGKARSLKKRVASYARLGRHSNRIARMIHDTVDMEFVTTSTETEALLLEANLIKRLKPRFNVTLRDDKSFPYILLTGDHPAPQVVKHRGARTREGKYFGPFASAGAVNRTINALQRAFLLRSCTDSYYESRTRPCLLYQIKRCSGPCTGEISLEDYTALVNEAEDFLTGRTDAVRWRLHEMMESASVNLDFERAAAIRDRLTALSHVQSHQGINPQGVEEADVFAAHQEAGQICIQVFFFRTGQNWGNRAYFPRAEGGAEIEEALESFVAQFYDERPAPRCIMLSHDVPGRRLLADALSLSANRKVTIQIPQRGERRELVNHALVNAREALARRLADTASQSRLLARVTDIFKLASPPKRVEVFDNSHITGTNAVGAMIVAGPEGFIKTNYRKFNMRSEDLTPGDDYAMMREMLTRRYARLRKETETDPNVPRPDLVLIDGGPGQLSAARGVMRELGIDDIPVASIAKGPDRNAGRERIYLSDGKAVMLEQRDPVLYYVQRLRDEAHRFAIGAHRARRSKSLSVSPLDGVPGIGPSRKRALLRHFGSAKAVSRAGIADLESVEGISAGMARAIYGHFHEQRP